MIKSSVRVFAALLAAAALVELVLPASAAAATCANQVLADWSDNGRIDRVYPLHCYSDAINSLPTDLRDYTNAGDVIRHALTSAVRQESAFRRKGEVGGRSSPESGPAVAALDLRPIPSGLSVVAAIATILLVAGSVAYLSRRRRARLREPE